LTPNPLALARVGSGDLPTTAHSSASGREENTRACSRPHHAPVPTTATLVRRPSTAARSIVATRLE
jgi:hypothetical protein